MSYLDRQRDRRRSRNSLIVFDPAVSAEHRDAVNLTLWAAERHTDRSQGSLASAPAGWLHACRVVLGKFGWLTLEEAHRTVADVGEPIAAAADILRDALADSTLAEVLLDELEGIGNWPIRARWVGAVREVDGVLLLSTVLLDVSRTSVEEESPEDEPVVPRFRIEILTWTAQLNAAIYDKAHEALLLKLEKAEPELKREDEREQQIRDRIAFIDRLEMPPDDTLLESAPGREQAGILETVGADDQDSGFVAKGQLLSFVAGVHGPARRDVLDCTLLAQDAADRKFSRETAFVSWRRFYLKVLMQTSWHVQRLPGAGPKPGQTVAEASLSMLRSGGTAPELSVAEAVLNAADQGASAGLEGATAASSAACFQLASCTQAMQRVTMTIVVMHVEMAGAADRILRQRYEAGADWLAEMYRCSLDLDEYAPLRSSVRRRLRASIEQFVHALAI